MKYLSESAGNHTARKERDKSSCWSENDWSAEVFRISSHVERSSTGWKCHAPLIIHITSSPQTQPRTAHCLELAPSSAMLMLLTTNRSVWLLQNAVNLHVCIITLTPKSSFISVTLLELYYHLSHSAPLDLRPRPLPESWEEGWWCVVFLISVCHTESEKTSTDNVHRILTTRGL